MKGNTGKILHVNLSESSFRVEEPDELFYRTYVGGACTGAYYVFKGMPAGVDALAPENVLAFTIGPIVGAPISGNARHCVTAKSPLTGGIASSEGGGFWGPELKFAGFDGIVITGKAPRPVYLWVHDGGFELREAAHLWGTPTGEVQEAIRSEVGDPQIRVAQIGPAGEKLVRFAAITNELKHFNGHAGLEAVMGAKNLRAVAVRGKGRPELHDPKCIQEMARIGAARIQAEGFWKDFKKYGTALNVTWNTSLGGLPTRNWTMGTFARREDISAETYAETMMDSPGTCWACSQSCKRDLKSGITQPWSIDPRYGGPEYETVGMMGSNCLVGDLAAIAKANEIASKYCMDTISLGGVVGLVMECFEKGLLSSRDTGGIEARFGDGEALVRLAELTGRREGFGDLMAEGTARLARRLGPEAERIAVHVKGKESPAHMPTSKAALGLIYAVNPLGPDHVSSEHDPAIADEPGEILKGLGLYEGGVPPEEMAPAKARFTAYTQRFVSALDSFSICQFCFHTWAMYNLVELLQVMKAATGWDYTMQEFMLLGERRVNLMRAFNAREGFSSKDDMLPERLFEDGLLDDGLGRGRKIDRQAFLRCREEYYRLNGWDPESGNPTPAKLRELGLGWAAELP